MDWITRIKEARERGEFTLRDRDLAENWPDCACGEQDPRIPRYEDGEPDDEILTRLGTAFCRFVDRNAFDGAEDALLRIELRSSHLLAELDKGVNHGI